MALADSVRDRRALLRRLIVAELIARPGEGPLARLKPMPLVRRPAQAASPATQKAPSEPDDPEGST